MLSEDIELVGSVMEDNGMWSHKREAWVRIKTALSEAQKTPTSSKSMPCQHTSVVNNNPVKGCRVCVDCGEQL